MTEQSVKMVQYHTCPSTLCALSKVSGRLSSKRDFGQLPAACVQFMRECSHDVAVYNTSAGGRPTSSGLHQANISVGSAQAEATSKVQPSSFIENNSQQTLVVNNQN